MTQTYQALLALIRASISDELEATQSSFPEGVDWNLLMKTSSLHKVGVMAVDGLQRILDSMPDIDMHYPEGREDLVARRKWMGQSVLAERKYADHERIMAELSAIYATKGIRMMVLKGYGMSLNYPIPEHRPGGDIDTYHFGLCDEADALVSESLGVKIDSSHHHHTTFRVHGVLVENHYDFINVHAHKDAPAIEAKLKELANKDFHSVDVLGETIYLPSVDFNTIFLMRHMAQHFAGERITLRQVLDWGLFMKSHSSEVNWEMASAFLQQIGLWDFCMMINSICVEYLGIDASCFPGVSDDKSMVDRIMNDILEPEFSGKEPKPFLKKWIFKSRRWWSNRWKHRLVYNDSLFSTAYTLTLSYLRKPKR